MKLNKAISLILALLLVIGASTVAVSAAQTDEESVGYSNQSFLEATASKASGETGFGSTYSPASTLFKTWSPNATSIKVRLYRTGSDREQGAGVIGEYAMTKNSDNGVWTLNLSGDHKNQYYTYIVTVNGSTKETQDIYSKAAGVNGSRSMVVDLNSTNPDGWSSDKHVVFDNPGEAVVWEVHVRDFSISDTSGVSYDNRGKYLGFTEAGTKYSGTSGDISTGIDYLVKQGINCVQLMPVFDFNSVDETSTAASNRNWGYDPVNYNVPEGSYSTNPYDGNIRIKEFKQMIQALHDRNISVVMDVVYNHTATTQSCFEKTVPGYYYRMNSSTSYSNGSGCGNETASDKAMFRKYMIDSCVYWMSEYHIDGFRFDLMGLHDVTTMNSIRSSLDSYYSDGTGQKILMYGEPWRAASSLNPDEILSWEGTGISRLDSRVGAFGDQYRDAIKGDTDGTGKGFVQGNTEANISKIVSGVKGKVYSAATPKGPAQAIAYADAHDNLIMWDKIVKSNGSSDYTGTNTEFQKQMKEIYTLLLTSQGIPFMTAGSEFGRTKQGDTNSYKSPDSINAIDWSRVEQMSGLADYYKGLLQIRKHYTSLHSSSIIAPSFQSDWGNVVAYTYTNNTAGEWNKLAVLVNGGTQTYQISLDGTGWVIVANGTSAGLTRLGEASGKIYSIPPKGCAVLVDKTSFNNLQVSDQTGKLTVNHVDKSGNILKTKTTEYKAGMTYRAEPDADLLYDYELVQTQGATSGTVAAGGSYTVTFVYDTTGEGSGFVNVTYVDSNGTQLAESETTRYKVGASYSTAPVAIPGYELDTTKIPANAAGVFSDTVNIRYVYKPLSSGTVTIHYKNTNNWTNVRCYAYSKSATGAVTELNGSWNSAKLMTAEGNGWYTTTISASSVYALFHNGNGSSNTAQDPGEVGYICTGEVWIENGVTTFNTKVVTSHVDLKTGQKIAQDVVVNASEVKSTGSYTTSPLSGRTDYIAPKNASGSYSIGAVNVVYCYSGTDDPDPDPDPGERLIINGSPVNGVFYNRYYVNGYAQNVTGLVAVNGLYYMFDENHMTEGRFTGIYFEGSGSNLTGRYFENGIASNPGIVLYQGDFYCTTTDGWLVKGVKTISQSRTSGLIPAGTYTFGDDYKMVDTTVKNGVYGGVYYENGVAKNVGLVKVGSDYYYTTSGGKIVYGDQIIYSSRTNGLLPGGVTYHFDETTGKLYKDNVIIDDVYYKEGKASNVGIVKVAGSYYVTTTKGVIVKNAENKYIASSRTNGLVAIGYYDFGADGKMILKNGIIGGKYYKDGKATNVGLFEYEADGVTNIYCTTTGGVILKNVTNKYIYSSRTNGLAPAGYYSFDADGKMIK